MEEEEKVCERGEQREQGQGVELQEEERTQKHMEGVEEKEEGLIKRQGIQLQLREITKTRHQVQQE